MPEKRTCEVCDHAYWWPGQRWMHVHEEVSSPSASRATSPMVDEKPVAKAVAVKPVKPPAAEAARSNESKKSWRERDPEAYREYMRGYMARRRAARRVSG